VSGAAKGIVAIIPARGGSKGIPRKNLALVGGRPLIAWTIESARRTPEIDRVLVSTDDEEIAAVARDWGAEVVRRPASIAGDEASSESALRHALDELAASGGDPELIVFLQATSPSRRPRDISDAITTLRREGADSLFSASPVHGFVWRRGMGSDGWSSFSYDHRHRQRRQDSPEDVIENGSIYVFRPRILRETGNRLGGRIAVHRMDPLDSFQVDEPEDLALFERLLRDRRFAPSGAELSRVRLLVLDFDGVMTDNRVHVDQEGRETVSCDRGDGLGITRLRDAGLEILVLSKEKNPVVTARCRKLGIEAVQGLDDKLSVLQRRAAERGRTPEEIVYVGNDVNDLACMGWVGLPVAVADAEGEVRDAAKWITQRPGGRGAVREVCDAILEEIGPRAARRPIGETP
jgi:N-acylneuraminate cytidylyltransferase